jgi:hypothetical protein
MNGIFNNADFFPTPKDVIFKMLAGVNTEGKTILEPSAGKGDIINELLNGGANVLYCETSEPLQKILNGKGRFLCSDFLNVKSEDVSHINAIVMNPPFSKGAEHILHAYEVAPYGCDIVALCNLSTLKNVYSNNRKELLQVIESNGSYTNLGSCFDEAERKTGVEVAMIRLKKAGSTYEQEFEGFFMDEEEETNGSEGLMSYDVVRDLVNRYVAAVKIYDEQLNVGIKMNNLLNSFYGKGISFVCTEDDKPKLRNEFKKDLQRAGWKFIFNKLSLEKDMTRGVKESINKFIEEQTQIPFTVKNIWQMLNIIVQTRSQTYDKAIEEVFDKLTLHHDENRYNVQGWKSNSHYLIGKKFILPRMCEQEKWDRQAKSQTISTSYGGYFELMEDLNKALCYITGVKYSSIGDLKDYIRYRWKVTTKNSISFHQECDTHYNGALAKKQSLYEQGIQAEIKDIQCVYGECFDWGFFKVKAFKAGTMHFEFFEADVWGLLNQNVARIKGFPLYEYKQETDYQKRNAGKPTEPKQKANVEQEILFTVNL